MGIQQPGKALVPCRICASYKHSCYPPKDILPHGYTLFFLQRRSTVSWSYLYQWIGVGWSVALSPLALTRMAEVAAEDHGLGSNLVVFSLGKDAVIGSYVNGRRRFHDAAQVNGS